GRLGTVDVELVDGGEKAPGIDALLEIGVIDRDVERRLAVAVDHARHAAGATLGAGGALAGPRPRRRLHLLDGPRHLANPLATKRPPRSVRPILTGACLQACPEQACPKHACRACGPSRRRRAVPAVRRAYSERDGERQECARAPAAQENDGEASGWAVSPAAALLPSRGAAP